jgi:hypothetical protein
MTASDQATAYERSWSGTADCVHFWREPRYGDMECLTARYRDHHYVPHVHETYAIGVIIEGAEAWHYRGARHVAGPGEIVSVMPGELHDGEAEDQLFAYRMLYPSVAQVRRALAEAGLPNPPLPTIPETKIEDRELASALVRLHSLLERGACASISSSWRLWPGSSHDTGSGQASPPDRPGRPPPWQGCAITWRPTSTRT